MPKCIACGAENPENVAFCGRCSTVIRPPSADTPYAPPPQTAYAGGLIPRNSPALLSYYLGLFSIFPFLGLPMAIVALVQGPKGLRLAKEQPATGGKMHAGIGIGCGVIGLLFNLFIVGGLILLFTHRPSN
jgi:hypothetical protein